MAEINYEEFIPAHLQDNYRQIVAERHGGDWSRLARHFDAHGEPLLAKWAAAQGVSGPVEVENTMAKTETVKRGPGRPRKTPVD